MPLPPYVFLLCSFNELCSDLGDRNGARGRRALLRPPRRREFDARAPARYQMVTRSAGVRYILSPGLTLNAS
jgi:hypothetical protein